MGDPFDRVVQRLAPGCKLLRAWSLKGGVSALVTALEIQHPNGRTQKWLLREHGEADRNRDPDIALHEFQLLQILQGAGLATPRPYGVTEVGLVVEFIEGEPVFTYPDPSEVARQMAAHLARIHQVQPPGFLPNHTEHCAALLGSRPAVLDDTLEEGRLREALEGVWPLPQRNRPTLLHGDYWPGNILWRDGRLVGIIDWEDACAGDPAADLANTRLEVLWAYGPEAMHTFTDHYRSLVSYDLTDLPYWDLFAALRPAGRLAAWAGGVDAEQRMRDRHHWFVEQAFVSKKSALGH